MNEGKDRPRGSEGGAGKERPGEHTKEGRKEEKGRKGEREGQERINKQGVAS